MERVRDAGAGFRSITEAVDTTPSAGRMVMRMLGSFAEFERSMVRERTRAGLAAARDRGVKVGRPANLLSCLRCLWFKSWHEPRSGLRANHFSNNLLNGIASGIGPGPHQCSHRKTKGTVLSNGL